jgi:hypothetical protein
MGAREVVLSYRSAFDASGAQSAFKANEAVAGSVQRYGSTVKGASDRMIDFEVKERRVEAVTKNVSAALFTAAQSGSAMQGGMRAGAAALDFLGNAAGSLAGPVGIAILLASNLASAFLAVKANATEAKEKVAEVMSASEAYSIALDALSKSGRAETDSTVQRLKAKQREVETASQINRLAESGSEAIRRYNEAEAARLDVSNKLTEAKDRLRRLTEYERAAYPQQAVQIEESIRRLTDELGKAASKTTALEAQTRSHTEASKGVASAFENQEGALAGVIEAEDTWQTARQRNLDLGWETMALEYRIALQREMLSAGETARIQKERMLRIAAAQNVASIAGSLASFMEATGSKSFGVMKALRYGEAVINTAAGVMQALGTIAPPYSYIAAAATAAAGAVQIATIASTNPGAGSVTTPSMGGGGGGGFPTGGGGDGPGPFTLGAGGAPGGSMAGATVTVTIESLVFQGLDPDSVPAGQMRRFVRRFAEMLSFEFNALGNRIGR